MSVDVTVRYMAFHCYEHVLYQNVPSNSSHAASFLNHIDHEIYTEYYRQTHTHF